MKFTVKQLIAKGYVKDPTTGSWSKPGLLPRKDVPTGTPHTQPQHHAGSPLVPTRKDEEKGKVCFIVRITGHRLELLDPDNFAGGCKFLIDQLRYAKLIPEDDPSTIRLITDQVRVSRKEDEGTHVEIEQVQEGAQ